MSAINMVEVYLKKESIMVITIIFFRALCFVVRAFFHVTGRPQHNVALRLRKKVLPVSLTIVIVKQYY